MGGGCSGHAEHGLSRGVRGHAPPEIIGKWPLSGCFWWVLAHKR